MSMRSLVIAAMVTAALLIPKPGATAGDKEAAAKEAALGAAKIWLGLVDEGYHGSSWMESAKYFRDSVTKEGWVRMVSGVRGPLGALKKRTLRSAQHATTLPGAPDGEYFVIQYDASFEHKADAVETVTTMLDQDGKWRVAGYFIR